MQIRTLTLAAAAVALVLSTAAAATAAPGDYRLVTGTLVWPIAPALDRTLVIQGDDGVTRFAELEPATTLPTVRAGGRVSVLGREGFQSDRLLFAQVERREDATPPAAGGDAGPATLPATVVVAPAGPDILDSADVVVGVVDFVRGAALGVTTRRGERVQVDVSALDADIVRDLRAGDQVTLLVPTRPGGIPVATGILVDHGLAPSALPR